MMNECAAISQEWPWYGIAAAYLTGVLALFGLIVIVVFMVRAIRDE